MDASVAARRLRLWYHRHARPLPWRRRLTPYKVLVTEFMLQQTRVETGLTRWPRFLRRFPTLRRLAHASEEDVLTEWSGLGYYNRARNLHRTARILVAQHRGRIPRDAQTLLGLPGVGPYIAGAVASIAYDEPVPAIDGNHRRVLGRLLRTQDPRKIHAYAKDLLLHGSPRLLNQALMDVGSTVCLPRTPRCGACPLAPGCASADATPAPTPRPKRVRVEAWTAHLSVDGDRVLLLPPRGQGLLGHQWLPPMTRGRRVGPADIVHKFSHRHWHIHAQRVAAADRHGRWVSLEELPRLPHGALTRRLMEHALAPQ